MSDNADQQVDRASEFFGCTQGLQRIGVPNLNEPFSTFPRRYGPFEIWQLRRTRWSTHVGESIGGWTRQRGHWADSNQTLALPLFCRFIQLFNNCRKGSNEMWWIMERESVQHNHARQCAPFRLDQWRCIHVQIMNKKKCFSAPDSVCTRLCLDCYHPPFVPGAVPLLLTGKCLQVLLA